MQTPRRSWVVLIAIKAIDLYSNMLKHIKLPSCRFFPSCSAYAREAFTRYGAVRGGLLTAWRIARCQSFSPGGHDPVR